MLASIYSDNAKPNLTGGQSYEIGTQFRALRDGWLVGVRVYRNAPNDTGSMRARLWSEDGGFIAYTPASPAPATLGWMYHYFTLPVKLDAGKVYAVSYTSPGSFAATDSISPALGLFGGAALEMVSGVYGSPLTFPGTPHLTSSYYVDPLVSFDPPRIPFSIGAGANPPPGDPNSATPPIGSLLIGDRLDFANLPWPLFPGWDFLVTDFHFISKILGAFTFPGEDPNGITPASISTWRNSYFHLFYGGIMVTVTSEDGNRSQASPLVIPSGAPISFTFQNSAPEFQNMEGGVQGWLVPAGSWRALSVAGL